jgi:integration host factor subunit beta
MVKSKLVQKLCNIHPNILRKDMEKIVEIIFSEITYALCRNETVEIRGFGRFKAVVRKSRIGRNPKNSNAVQIPEKKVMKWKMSKILYKRLNRNLIKDSKVVAVY